MKLGDCDSSDLSQTMQRRGIRLRSGPFVVRLHGRLPKLVEQLHYLYPETEIFSDEEPVLTDFFLGLERPLGIRRWARPQIRLVTDWEVPFEPFPFDHALPLFEWGLNWRIAMQAHQFLMLHAAAVARKDHAIIMPALPGSGKSTLCAALMLRGWRLLSDEFGLIRPDDPDLALHSLPRVIPLKNASIEVIRDFSDQAVLGPTFPKTRKGDVAHLAPTAESQRRWTDTAQPRLLLFPLYQAGAHTELSVLNAAEAFTQLAGNSFNYRLQGARGFRALTSLGKRCPAYRLVYSNLDDAIARINALLDEIVKVPPTPASE